MCVCVCVCVFVCCEKKLERVQGWEGVCWLPPGICLIKLYCVAWAYLTIHL